MSRRDLVEASLRSVGETVRPIGQSGVGQEGQPCVTVGARRTDERRRRRPSEPLIVMLFDHVLVGTGGPEVSQERTEHRRTEHALDRRLPDSLDHGPGRRPDLAELDDPV